MHIKYVHFLKSFPTTKHLLEDKLETNKIYLIFIKMYLIQPNHLWCAYKLKIEEFRQKSPRLGIFYDLRNCVFYWGVPRGFNVEG